MPLILENPSDVTAVQGGTFSVTVNVEGSGPFTYQWRKSARVTTLAGMVGTNGSADGQGASAKFNNPAGMAVDTSGNIYVADRGNHTIRKVTPAGVVTTLAGSPGVEGHEDGTASAALFSQPYGVAVDSVGNVYVGDSGNKVIRKVTPGGAVTTLAGSAGIDGSADGTGSDARFRFPTGLVVDGSGTLFVGDWNNSTIRRVTAAGAVTTFAGSAGVSGHVDGTGSAASFLLPYGLALTSGGDLIVGDLFGGAIRKVSPASEVTTFVGDKEGTGSLDGLGTAARFSAVAGLGFDGAGNLYALDYGNFTVRKITPNGLVTRLAGMSGASGWADGSGNVARFDGPLGLAVDGNGIVYVADTNNQVIRKIELGADVEGATSATYLVMSAAAKDAGYYECVVSDAEGTVVTSPVNVAVNIPPSIVGQPVGGTYLVGEILELSVSASGTEPLTYLWKKDGEAVAGATNASYVLEGVSLGTAGTYQCIVTNVGGEAVSSSVNVVVHAPATFSSQPTGGTILVGTELKLQAPGQGTGVLSYQWKKKRTTPLVSTVAGSAGFLGGADGLGEAARFAFPTRLTVDFDGNVFVSDQGNHAVRKLTSSGDVTTLAGSAGFSGSVDGSGSAARFTGPAGIAVDRNGNVYVADSGNHAIRVVSQAGNVETLAGSLGQAGSADAIGLAALFSNPQGVAVDLAGSVYVADTGNYTVRKIQRGGLVLTLSGSAGVSGGTEGLGSLARFSGPEAVTVDVGGGLVVADKSNGVVRRITSSGTVTLLAGSYQAAGSLDGTGVGARFLNPTDVAEDGMGNVYVADQGNHTIRRISPTGVVTTLAGVAGAFGSADGIGAEARFDSPSGVAVDLNGDIYVADRGNHTIRKISLWEDIPGATESVYRIGKTVFEDSGEYECVVVNEYGGAATRVVKVVVNVPPTITAQPVGGTVVVGGSVVLSVSATGTGPVSYQWRKDGVNVAGATGARYEFTATSLSGGTYDCYLSQPMGYGTTNPAVVDVKNRGTGIVGGTFNLPMNLNGGSATYVATTLPAGLTLNNATGVISGVPTRSGSFAVKVTQKTGTGKGPTLVFVIDIAALSKGVVGTFHGLVERDAVLNGNLASSLQITTTATGACSGKIQTGVVNYPFKGQLSSLLRTPTEAGLSVEVPKVGTLHLTFDGEKQTVRGALNKGASSASVGAWRNGWVELTEHASDYKGFYTFYLSQSSESLTVPQGDGIGSFTINPKSGALIASGILADGTKFSSSTFLGQSGQVLLYTPLYGKLGSLAGVLSVNDGVDAPLGNTISGTPTWLKPASLPEAKDTVYASGFGPVELTASGGVYVAPSAGAIVMGLSAGAGNAELVFSDGGLAGELVQSVTVSSLGAKSLGNKATVPINANKVALTVFTVANGAFGGTFTLEGTERKATFNGLFVRESDGKTRGYGYFLLPGAPGEGQKLATVPKLSGRVYFAPKVAH